MVIFSKLLPSTNSKSRFLLDVTTIRSIHLTSLNITNLIPISAFIHYLFFSPRIIPNLFHFSSNSLPKCLFLHGTVVCWRLSRAACLHHFQMPHSGMSHWQPEIHYCGIIHTQWELEIGKHYRSGLFLFLFLRAGS